MIRQISILRYEGEQARSMGACGEWIVAQISSLPYLEMEELLQRYFNGEWAYYRTLVAKFDSPEIEFTEGEARRLKAILSHLLAHAGLSFSSPVGMTASPLLHDLANLQAAKAQASA
jgi:hypothetical protein